ncbi:22951_t:CDS:2 [Dentiscutata erythropus]|uniref:22951_t:CDS:1 n=1 Tax=Dentiscutata erythropus TaxID=1348616 RepID=A0A9N9NLP0_9GLOM|nr:22951_t:CDS:2 [Dentiscutata erythropus]
MSDNIFGFLFSDPYFYTSSEEQDTLLNFSFSASQHSYIESNEEHTQFNTIQELIQLSYEQQSNEESNRINEDNECKIENGAEFPN